MGGDASMRSTTDHARPDPPESAPDRPCRPQARATLAACGLLTAALILALPRPAAAECDAEYTVQGCCAGSVLRNCTLAGDKQDIPCNTKPPNPVYGPYYCGHDKSTASLMGCYTADGIDYSPASGNVWCPGYCLYGCKGDDCQGNCSATQTCDNGTCKTKPCGHPSFLRPHYASYFAQTQAPAAVDVTAVCTSPVAGWAVAVRKNGTLVAWGDNGAIVDHANVKAITDAVQVACTQGSVTVMRANGSLVGWGSGGPPAQLTGPTANVVTIAASDEATAALRTDGSITIWGSDIAGKHAILNGKTGFKGIGGGEGGFVGIKLDGSLVVAARDGTQLDNTFLPPPAGLTGVIMTSLGGSGAIALKQDGQVVVWGAKAPGPPADLKPCTAVAVGNYGDTFAFLALQVDGKVRAWGQTYDPDAGGVVGNVSKALQTALGNLGGVTTLDPHGGALAFCTGTCGAVSSQGCCYNAKLYQCGADGTLAESACSGNSCGWQASAGEYQCGTSGAPAPGDRPLQSCICVPSCKNPDGSTAQCGSDGCGGTCDKGSCDDGDPCTVEDKCSGDACQGTKPYDCGDGNVCTDDACSDQGGKAACTNTANQASCSDGSACTTNDGCASGGCQPGATLDCDDANVCTDDACDATAGCTHTANAATCSDGNACTVGDACAAKACKPGAAALDCADGNACTVDGCDPKTGCKYADAPGTTLCDDGSDCTADDKCLADKCKGVSNVDCDDGNPCTSDNCVDASTCADHLPILEGQPCSDGNACKVGGKCAQGACAGLQPLGCDDGNPCTDDACDPETGCTHAANTAPCSDDDTCTVGDVCAGSACKSGKPLDCNDNNPCTSDGCAKATGCSHAANSAPCDDGSVCTGVDACAGGTCVGSAPKDCGDGQPCTIDTCNALLGCQHAASTAPCDDGDSCTKGDACWQGTCVGGATPACNDGNPCTDDTCDGAKGCVHQPNSHPCSDGDPCTLGDGCKAGGCQPGAGKPTCDDGNGCTTDACVAGKGCVFTNNGQACDDGEVCSVGDACKDGACAGKPAVCDDGNPCTDDTCTLGKGCTAVPNAAACNDGNPCTIDDACVDGGCAGGGLKSCDDGNPCTDDFCAPSGAGPTGCYHSGWQKGWVGCDDGNPCTLNDHCVGGGCKSGSSVCINGGCDLSTGSPKCSCPAGWQSTPYPESNDRFYCCQPKCAGKACGPDGCGGQCPNLCGKDEICSADWGYKCIPAVACYGKAPLGVGCCDGAKLSRCFYPNNLNTWDCSAQGKACGWIANGQEYGCTDYATADPSGKQPYLCPGVSCTPSCAGKPCGPDGCGGSCGACGGGLSCDLGTGQCVNPCDGVATVSGCLQGTIDGQDVLATCPKIQAKVADVQQVVCPPDKPVGWYAAAKRFVCGGKDEAPQGVAKACPAKACDCGYGVLHRDCGDDGCGGSCGTCTGKAVCHADHCCTPSCDGKTCGSDGCGGSCGTCGSGQDCLPGGSCAVAECVGMPSAQGYCGSQQGAGGKPVLHYCGANAKQSVDCAAIGAMCDATGAQPTCAAGTYGISGGWDYKGWDSQRCATRPEKWRCGNYGGVCDCGPDCESNGTCCADYSATCSAQHHAATCGDKSCNAAAGETCETCSADCGACKDATAAAGPWQLPYAAYVERPGQPDARASHAIRPLDDVRPQGPPLPLDGLLAWLPARDGAQTAPGTRVLERALAAGGAVAAVSDGVQGPAVSFVDGQGKNRGGMVTVLPDAMLPRPPSFQHRRPGGVTVAGWVRLSPAAKQQPNTLGSARAASQAGRYACAWSRPQSAEAPLACGGAGTIVAVRAYYGEVEHPRFPPGPYGDDGTLGQPRCHLLPQLGPTWRCHDDAVQALAEKACLGKSSCWVNPWGLAADPCSAPPHKPIQSTLVLQAVCEPGPMDAAVALSVGGAKDGRRLRLVGAGLPPLESAVEIPSGKWVHVAVTFAPHGLSAAGTVRLYVDGEPQAVQEAYAFPNFFAWDWGVGPADGATSGWDGYLDPGPNTRAPNLGGHFDLDDAVLYDRALTPVELSSLVAKPAVGTLRVWPAIDAARVVRSQQGAVAGKATTTAVRTPQIVDPATGQPRAADFEAVTVAGGHFAASAAGGDLDGLDRFTLAGWVRVASPKPGAPLFALRQGDAARLQIEVDASCGGQGLRVALPGGGSVTTKDCAHGLQAGAWAFVGYVQNGSVGTLFLDGARLGSVAAKAPIFDAAAGGARSFRAGEGVDLGWAALYGRALSVGELNAQRNQGPAVWLDGHLYLPAAGGEARPRDFAAFRNAGASGDGGAARALDDGGKPFAAAGALKSGVVVVPADGRFHAAASTVGATAQPGRVYTWTGTVRVPTAGGSLGLLRRVASGAVTERLRLACTGGKVGSMVCKVAIEGGLVPSPVAKVTTWTSDGFSVSSTAAAVDLRLAVAFDGQAATGAVTAVDPAGTAQATVQLGAIAQPGSEPRKLAFYGGGKLVDAKEAPQWQAGGVDGLVVEAAAGTGGQPLRDTRLYNRLLGVAELQRVVVQDCAGQSCGAEHRACVAPAANPGAFAMTAAGSLAACAGCAADAYEDAGTCVAKAGFRGQCAYAADCLSGLCVHGHCRSTSADALCVAECLKLGRACVAQASGGFECASSCLADFAAVGSAVDPVSGEQGAATCAWKPSRDIDQTCSTSQSCASAVCAARTSTAYNVTNTDTKLSEPAYENPVPAPYKNKRTGPFETCTSAEQCAKPAPYVTTENVCAASTQQACRERAMKARLVHGQGWDGNAKDAYVCEGCLTDTYKGAPGDPNNGKPLYVQGWSMLSPQACRTIYESYFKLLTNGVVTVGTSKYHANKDGWADHSQVADMGDILAHPPQVARLRKLLLLDPDPAGKPTPEVLAKLEQAGVGRVFLDPDHKPWTFTQYFTPKGSYGGSRPEQLRLGACARASYDFTNYEGWQGGHAKSKFFERDLNRPVCIENKFPNGTPCPPAGAVKTYTRANAGLFCASGFCAADTKVCETGYQAYEEVHGGARNDGNDGGSGNDLGAIALVQDNGSAFVFDRVDASKVVLEDGTTDHRHILLEGHSKNSVNIFGWAAEVLDLSVSIVEAPGAADEGERANVATELLVCGVQLPSLPELPKATCGAAQFENGEYTAPKCKSDKTSVGVTVSKTSKSTGKDGKTKEADAGVQVTDGDVVPTIAFPVPIPLQECPEDLDGFAAVFGRVCFAKQTTVGPVPFKVEAQIAPAAQVELGVEIDSDTFEPAAKISPSVGLELEVKGGVGGEIGFLELFAGVKGALTIIEAAFPVTFGFAFVQLTDGANAITDLWAVRKVIKASFELSFLKIALSVFFEVGVGPYKLELEYGFFEWEGIQLTWQIGEAVATEYKVDFQWDSYATSTASDHGGGQ